MGITAPSRAGLRNLLECQLVASGPVSASPSPTTQHAIRSGIVEYRAIGVQQRVTQFAAFVDGAGRFRRGVAGNSARKRKLLEQPLHALGVWPMFG